MRLSRLIPIIGGSSKIKVSDKFTDANDVSLDAHIPDKSPGGGLWTEAVGNWDIQSNQANVVSISTTAKAVIEAGIYNGTITVTNKTMVAADIAGILTRYVDANNWLLVCMDNGGDRMLLVQNLAGSLTVPYAGAGGSTVFTTGQDYTLKVTLSGSSIKAWVGATLVVDVTNTNFLTATKFGLYSEKTTAKFDDFSVSL